MGDVVDGGAVQVMKDLALRSRPHGGGFKPPHAALVEETGVVSDGEKAPVQGVRWGPGRRT